MSSQPPLRSVCVFCGSSFGARPEYREAARSFARLLAENGIRLVYGGASVGLMGEVADAALAAGGEVVGVLPRSLAAREIGHTSLTEQYLVDTLHERKAKMAELSDAFVSLPGGLGTLEELIEIVSWAQIGLHAKPSALLNVAGFYDGLISFIDHAVAEGFVSGAMRDLIIVDGDPQSLLSRLARYEPPSGNRWTTAKP